MSKEPRIQLDSAKLLGFKHIISSQDERTARHQAKVGASKVGNAKRRPRQAR
jgi:hypothetical protein